MIYEGKAQLFSTRDSRGQQDQNQRGIRSFEIKLVRFFSITGIGDAIELANALLGVCYVVLGIVLTYMSSSVVMSLGVVLNSYFLLCIGIKFITAENKIYYLLSYPMLIEYCSIIPFLLVYGGVVPYGLWVFPTTSARILTLFGPARLLSRTVHDSARLTYRLLIIILSILLIGSSFMVLAEQQQPLYFHDSFYLMLVTLSTVGYGDVAPQTMYGQLVIMASIISFLSFVPVATNQILRFNSLNMRFVKQTYLRTDGKRYLLLLGNSSPDALKTFLDELYHEDHGATDIQTLILQRQTNTEISLLLKSKGLKSVSYLNGDPIDFDTLAKVSTDKADCVVILANKFTTSQVRQDYVNIMYALAVKNFVFRTTSKSIRVCLQLLLSRHKDMFYRSLRAELQRNDQVICAEELKLKLMGKTCICAGINTLVSILVTSGNCRENSASQDWEKEYTRSSNNEIYRIAIPVQFKGKSFSSVAKCFFRDHGTILIAIEADLLGCKRVFLNPADYILADSQSVGYVIAESYQQVKSFSVETAEVDSFQSQNEAELTDPLEGYYTNPVGLKNSFYVDPKIFSKFSGHTIFTGDIRGLKHFLMPLRAKSNNFQQLMPIVVLHESVPLEIWKEIQIYPKVYNLKGSPLRIEDLKMACVQKAEAFVILSQFQKKGEKEIETNVLDADTIFIYRTVKLLNPTIKIFTELSSMGAISLLNSQFSNSSSQFNSQIFASGEILVSTMLDTMICQAYYHTFLIQIIQQMLLGDSNITPDVSKACAEKKLHLSNLFLINVPKVADSPMPRLKFKDLFEKLLYQYKMLTIAIYRARPSHKSYLYLRPDPDTELHQNDRIYVLSHRQPFELMTRSTTDKQLLKMDADNKKELQKLEHELTYSFTQTKNVLASKFQRQFVDKSFLPRVRKIINESFKDKGL